jgi:hypothetical protein
LAVLERTETLARLRMKTSTYWDVLREAVVSLGERLCLERLRCWAQIRLSVSCPSVGLVSEAVALAEEIEGFE